MSGKRKRPERERAHHLADYAALVRQRRLLACGVFLVVCGSLAARALFAEPVYRAAAMVQIEGKPVPGGLLGELAALESSSSTEAELEIMRSRLVALGAAHQLGPGDFLAERHALRPLDVLLARIAGGRPACVLRVETEAAAEGSPPVLYRFRFGGGAGGATLAIERERDGGIEVVETGPFRPGAAVAAFGRAFTIDAEGDPGGRCWELPMRSPLDRARWIQSRIRVEEVGLRTGVVHLGFEAPTPRLAMRVANELAASYLSLKTEQKRAQAQKASAFLAEATGEVHRALGEAEEALDRYRAETGAVLLSERAQWLVRQSSALSLERAEQQVLLADHEALLGRVDREEDPAALLAGFGRDMVDPVTAALVGRLAELDVERARCVQEGMLAAHPGRLALEAEVASARERLRGAVRETLRRVGERLASRIAHLDRTLEEFAAEERELPQAERRLAVLTREVTANLRIHQFLVEKEQEAQIALVSTLASVRRIDDALEPLERTSPDLWRTLIVGLLLGAAAALLAALFAEYLDRTVRSPQALEKGTGLALYAAIPHHRSVRRRGPRRSRAARGGLIVAESPHGVLAEAYRTLRTNLRFANLERPVRTLAITSSVMGEGKTLTIGNLAAVYAQQGDRVLLVDADLRRPSTHALLGNKASPGLSDVLQGRMPWRDAVRESGVAGFSVLHAGAKPANPGALLDSERMTALIEEVKAAYDFVMFDVPPILAVTDAAAFFRMLDGVLLLARDKTCPLEAVLDARDQIRRVGANLIGALFNGFDARGASRGGYGYYGYYGDYGEEPAGRAVPEDRLAGSL